MPNQYNSAKMANEIFSRFIVATLYLLAGVRLHYKGDFHSSVPFTEQRKGSPDPFAHGNMTAPVGTH